MPSPFNASAIPDASWSARKAPAVTLSSPGGTSVLGRRVSVDYACTDDGSGIQTCAGTLLAGAQIDTSRRGTLSFAVTGIDRMGNTVHPLPHGRRRPGVVLGDGHGEIGIALTTKPPLPVLGAGAWRGDGLARRGADLAQRLARDRGQAGNALVDLVRRDRAVGEPQAVLAAGPLLKKAGPGMKSTPASRQAGRMAAASTPRGSVTQMKKPPLGRVQVVPSGISRSRAASMCRALSR